MAVEFTATLRTRTPQQNAPAQRVTVGMLRFSRLTATLALNAPGEIQITLPADAVITDIAEVLAALDGPGVEVQIDASYIDGSPTSVTIAAGPVLGWQGTTESIQLAATTFEGLLRYPHVGDFAFSGTAGAIIKRLVDTQQNRDYGHFGIRTGTIDRTVGDDLTVVEYQAQDGVTVWDACLEIAENGGLDVWIDPDLSMRVAAKRATDKRAVYIARRDNTQTLRPTVSVAPGEYANRVEVVGTGDDATNIVAVTSEADVAKFGTADLGLPAFASNEVSALTSYVTRALANRSAELVDAQATVVLGDTRHPPGVITPGDIIGIDYDLPYATVETYAARAATVRYEVAPDAEPTVSYVTIRDDTPRPVAPPFQVAIVIDTSGSMPDNDPDALRVDGAKAFVAQMRNTDAAAVVLLNDPSSVELTMTDLSSTANRTTVNTAIDAGAAESGNTDIGGAATAAVGTLTGTQTTKIVLLLTDGQDTGGTAASAVASTINGASATCYTIGLGAGVDETYLSTIAGDTGGAYRLATDASDLVDTFEQIIDALLDGG